jgi:hypothetical protein
MVSLLQNKIYPKPFSTVGGGDDIPIDVWDSVSKFQVSTVFIPIDPLAGDNNNT